MCVGNEAENPQRKLVLKECRCKNLAINACMLISGTQQATSVGAHNRVVSRKFFEKGVCVGN